MFGRGCQYRHQNLKMAGIYKRNKYGQIARDKKGAKILLKAEETWACPYCRMLFIKPNRKYRRKVEKHGKLNNRTVPKVLRRRTHHNSRSSK